MFLVRDIRETRVYQEAFAEGFIEGFKRGFEQGTRGGWRRRVVVNLAARKISAEEIATILDVDLKFVREVLGGLTNRSR